MKRARRLSSVALVSLLGLNAGIALSKVPDAQPTSSNSLHNQPMIIANPFRIIRDAVRTVDQVNQIRIREQRRQEAERRQQELEAARREATEQQRLEAERRQQYFESLSPEEQQAYLAEQRAKQAQREKEANLFLLMLGAVMFGGSGAEASSAGNPNDVCVMYNSDGSVAGTVRRDQVSNTSGVECRSR